jgi:TP901 family phage tail tape measure protein
MKQIIGVTNQANQNMRNMSNNADKAGQSLNKMGNQAKHAHGGIMDMYKGMAKASVAMGMLGATVAPFVALKHATDTAIDFEAAMSKVKAVAESTPEEFKKLQKQAIDLGKNTSLTSQQVADGMYFMAAAGLKTNEIMDAMPGAINASIAAGEDFASVAEIMTTTMSGFGLTAKDMTHIGDVLAKSANESQASIMDLGYTFKYVAPIASAAGQSLETVAAASALLAKNGIKADTAGTSLRMGLERMAKLPKAARDTLGALGIKKLTDAKGNFLPLADMIDMLHDKMSKLSNSARIGAIANIFGTEASPAWEKLIEGGGDALRNMTDKMQNADGAAKQMADTMRDNAKGAIDQFKGSLESLEISAITPFLPMLKQMAEKASGVSDSLSAFFDKLQADEKFQNLGWDDKIVLVMNKATTALENYMSGPGGKKFDNVVSKLTEIGIKIGGALGSSIVRSVVAEIETSPFASIITGALAGAAVGSIVPGVGTAVGALIGAGGGFGHYIGNKLDNSLVNNPDLANLPGYATGLSYVPYDDMPVRVHRGERIMTAEENKSYSSGGGQVLVTGNTFHVRQESDIDAIARALSQHILTAGGAGA